MVDEQPGVFTLMLIRTAGLPSACLYELADAWPDEKNAGTAPAETVCRRFDALLAALDVSDFRTAVYNVRKAFFQKRKTPPESFLRLLAEHAHIPEAAGLMRCLELWEQEKKQKAAQDNRFESVLLDNFMALQNAARGETLQRALLFASHDLLDRLPSFRERPAADFNKKDRQTAFSLLKYLTRAAAKTSPLSRFTTVSFSRLTQNLSGETLQIIKPVATPNVALLPAIYRVLLREPAFYESLSLVLNPCITPGRGNTWLYFDGEKESFQRMEDNPVAGLVVRLLLSNRREMPFTGLLESLKDEVDATDEELQSLVFELVDFGLLEWNLPEKGLAPGWCGGLYHFLGFLPAQPPVIVETAALLQWLRASARSLPHQSIAEAQGAQREGARLTNAYFNRFGGEAPAVPPERIFFEDVEDGVVSDIPAEAVQRLARELAQCSRDISGRQAPPLHAGVVAFGMELLEEGETIDFLSFCEKFLTEKRRESGGATLPPASGKMGALLQAFRKEDGAFGAVVNGLFPGGGKLFARWMHLFPAAYQKMLEEWSDAIAFPWQGWSNTNFQPQLSADSVAVPDGRVAGKSQGRRILLGNIAVARKADALQLIDNETRKQIRFADLGLEATELRPPAMQILHCLGVPYYSLQTLVRKFLEWKPGGHGWRFRSRAESGSLVLLRASWEIGTDLASRWRRIPGDADFFRIVRGELRAMGVPGRFFARFPGEKPQYFDMGSPVLMLLFKKILLRSGRHILLTEMLPAPEQYVVRKVDGWHAAEFVVEIEI